MGQRKGETREEFLERFAIERKSRAVEIDYNLPRIEAQPDFKNGVPACLGLPTEWWFPQKPDYSMQETRAKSYCNGCPCKQECLEYRNKYQIRFGIWGGETELRLQQERLRRERDLQRKKDAAQDALEASHTSLCTSDISQIATMGDVEPGVELSF